MSARKISYKSPPTVITDTLLSQGSRRTKALEEQKRRRANRIDSSRQLDNLSFAHLNLGESDDEDGYDFWPTRDQTKATTGIIREGVAGFAGLLGSPTPSLPPPPPPQQQQSTDASDVQLEALPKSFTSEKKRNKNTKWKGKGKARSKNDSSRNEASKWADKCMYAELLEMAEDVMWSAQPTHGPTTDGLPDDIDSGWVAVAPVPVGKRCLAISYQSSGVAGQVPNTALKSRVLGKPLMAKFPSSLPPSTILDCILDQNWRQTGILHVLDVLKWKGQDVSDCETPFRFWWRDTRLGELPRSYPPANSHHPLASSHTPEQLAQSSYRFNYPVTLLPIPYHTDTSLSSLASQLIPLARSSRSISVDIPTVIPTPTDADVIDATMEVDSSTASVNNPGVPLVQVLVDVAADGMLLYVAEASYESGTSPLSSWIPINNYEEHEAAVAMEGPLDKFQRLVQRRLERIGGLTPCVPMDMET